MHLPESHPSNRPSSSEPTNTKCPLSYLPALDQWRRDVQLQMAFSPLSSQCAKGDRPDVGRLWPTSPDGRLRIRFVSFGLFCTWHFSSSIQTIQARKFVIRTVTFSRTYCYWKKRYNFCLCSILYEGTHGLRESWQVNDSTGIGWTLRHRSPL